VQSHNGVPPTHAKQAAAALIDYFNFNRFFFQAQFGQSGFNRLFNRGGSFFNCLLFLCHGINLLENLWSLSSTNTLEFESFIHAAIN
jgi:hypothetical protein